MLSKIISDDLKVISKDLGKSLYKLEGSTVLLTGATGLFGSYILDLISFANEYLFKKPCKVIALQRNQPRLNSRMGHLLKDKNIKFISHDVRKPFQSQIKFNYIICSAGMSAPSNFQADPLDTIDTNVNGIRWALEYGRKNPRVVKSIIYMSSGETYGNPSSENFPTPETYNGNVSTINTRSCYAESKRLAETLCSIYFNDYKVPVKIARSFAVYGPGITVEDKRVLGDFMRAVVYGKQIEMLSAGLDTRSFTYISDAITAFMKILLSDKNGEVYNVASGLEELKIVEIARLLHKICGINKSVVIKTKKKASFLKDAPQRVCPDVSKIKKQLKFKPRVSLGEGLKRTIAWNKEMLNV